MKKLSYFILWLAFASSFSIHSDETSATSGKGISSNPGAANLETGTGALGKALGFKKESGVRFGGLWIGDLNYLICGGLKPHKWGGINLLILSLSVDMEKAASWKGGLFGVEFLQFNGRQVNFEAGTVQGYNSLPGSPPLDRSELYQLWYRQEFFDKRVVVRVGKTLPNVDFTNVLRPVTHLEKKHNIPATTGLIYTPIFVIPPMLGVLPGYYNSVYGITITLLPTDNCYGAYGIYDGNLARNKQTGIRGPQFNGYRFQIAEIGCTWMLKKELPGNIAFGVWHQSGKLSVPKGPSERGTGGAYAFGTQRLWLRHPGVDNSGTVGFFQLGVNHSITLPMNKFIGAGLTFFGLTRINDSFGFGASLAWLNRRQFSRRTELILQGYYQLYLFEGLYFESVASYIPRPGAAKDLSGACAATVRLTALF